MVIAVLVSLLAACGTSDPTSVNAPAAVVTTPPVETVDTSTEESSPLAEAVASPAACLPLDPELAEGLISNSDTGERKISGAISRAAWVGTAAVFEDLPDAVFYSVVLPVDGSDVLLGFMGDDERTPDTNLGLWQSSNTAAEITGFPSSRPTVGLGSDFLAAALQCAE